MYKYFAKRSIDILFSFFSLMVLSPLLIIVSLGLLFTGEHYIFYFQKRIGFKNKPFYIWKFATMMKNSPNMAGGLYTMRKDPRLMPLGGLLRMTKINEIPQLINILIGDMSIVGPRPLVDRTFIPYSDFVKANIYNIRPGLTGIGSIVFRDEEKLLTETKMAPHEFYKEHIAPYKGELEIWYQQNLSFYIDAMLIFLTAWVIFFPKSNLVYRLFKNLPSKPIELDE